MNSSNETELKIQNFINRIQSDLKDEKTYSIDSVIWYSTGALNYTYAIYDSSLLNIAIDTSTFNVELDRDGKVTESDLGALIESMTDSLASFFEDLPVNTKHVMLCMVYEIGATEENLSLGLISAVGWGFSSTYYGSFGLTDYWHSVLDSGKCDIYHGQNIGQDAGDQLQFKIMHPLVQNEPNKRLYSIPLENFEFVNGSDYIYENAPRGYRIFYKTGALPWPGPECLDPDEMNFYISANGIPYVIDDLEPAGMEFLQLIITADVLWIYNTESYIEAHWLNLIYGELEETTIPASQL